MRSSGPGCTRETLLLDRLKTDFVAIASHELRTTPAASVYGVLATLVGRGDELGPDVREELLHVGYEQSARLRRCSSSCSTSRASARARS